MKLKVAFMGTPDFAIPALKLIHKSFDLVGCFTQPSRRAGRGQKISHSSVKNFCLKKNIQIFTPESFSKKKEINFLKKLSYDVLVVAAYGIILPKEVLEVTKFGALNIHASLLPRWRGAAPIQRAILAGDKKTGITIMKMNEKLDAGDIILQKEIEIKNNNTSQEIHDKLAEIGGRLIIETLKKIEKNTQLKFTPQDETKVTYAKKIKTNETKINWNKTGKQILRQIKAFGGWFLINKQRIKIFDAEFSKTKEKSPGLIIDKNFSISCGKGDLIKPKTLQKSGANKMDLNTFIKGFRFKINQKVE